MTDESFYGFGSVGMVAESFEIVISFLALAIDLSIDLFLTFPFRRLIVDYIILSSRGLIVESYWDCIAFGRPVKFWFRKRRQKPPDKLTQSKFVMVLLW